MRRYLALVAALVSSAACGPAVTATQAVLVPPTREPISSPSPIPFGLPPDALLFVGRNAETALLPVDLDHSTPLIGEHSLPLAAFAFHAFSPDGRTLAVVVHPHAESAREAALHWIDLSEWRQEAVAIPLEEWVFAMAFSPDGSHLAIASDASVPHGESNVRLFEAGGDQVLQQTRMPFMARQMSFSADGEFLAVYGVPFTGGIQLPTKPPVVSVLGGTDLSPRWSAVLEGVVDGTTPIEGGNPQEPYLYWTPGVAFTADGRSLFLVHADANRLTRVDLVGERVTTVDIAPPQTWLDRLMAWGTSPAYAKGSGGTTRDAVLSADGSRIYSVGNSTVVVHDDHGGISYESHSLGLQVIDTATGTELEEIPTEASEISLAQDGTRLLLHGWDPNSREGWTEVLSSATLGLLQRVPALWLVPVRNSEGRWFYLGTFATESSTLLKLLDADVGNELASWHIPGYVGVVAAP